MNPALLRKSGGRRLQCGTKSALLVLILALCPFLPACDDGDLGEIDFEHLFDRDFGLVAEADPDIYWPGDVLEFTARARPRFDGVGQCRIGSDYYLLGEAEFPVEGEVGILSAPVVFTAGETAALTWGIRVLIDREDFEVFLGMTYDSLLIEGEMRSVDDPEVAAFFGTTILTSIGGRVRVEKETP